MASSSFIKAPDAEGVAASEPVLAGIMELLEWEAAASCFAVCPPLFGKTRGAVCASPFLVPFDWACTVAEADCCAGCDWAMAALGQIEIAQRTRKLSNTLIERPDGFPTVKRIDNLQCQRKSRHGQGSAGDASILYMKLMRRHQGVFLTTLRILQAAELASDKKRAQGDDFRTFLSNFAATLPPLLD